MTITISTDKKDETFESKTDEYYDLIALLEENDVMYDVKENGKTQYDDTETVSDTVPPESDAEEDATPADTEVIDNRPDHPPSDTDASEPPVKATEPETAELPDLGVDTDPIEILPDYMIDHVKGTPTLNKRGLSVLAFHYDVSVTDREIVVSPHESDWKYAIVETTIQNEDGNTFVGTGTAHVDRGDDKGTLLEMAETRSYKRAVSFGTGTGIVAFQELSNQLE